MDSSISSNDEKEHLSPKKAEKEEQMKRLTVAYENSDFSTLLELEQEYRYQPLLP